MIVATVVIWAALGYIFATAVSIAPRYDFEWRDILEYIDLSEIYGSACWDLLPAAKRKEYRKRYYVLVDKVGMYVHDVDMGQPKDGVMADVQRNIDNGRDGLGPWGGG